jgi:hypothetical protein
MKFTYGKNTAARQSEQTKMKKTDIKRQTKTSNKEERRASKQQQTYNNVSTWQRRR